MDEAAIQEAMENVGLKASDLKSCDDAVEPVELIEALMEDFVAPEEDLQRENQQQKNDDREQLTSAKNTNSGHDDSNDDDELEEMDGVDDKLSREESEIDVSQLFAESDCGNEKMIMIHDVVSLKNLQSVDGSDLVPEDARDGKGNDPNDDKDKDDESHRYLFWKRQEANL